MRPIDKFILHVVHNLSPLFEYDQKQMDILINHYKQEADDLNINITDEQLKAYINRFEQLKTGIIAKGGTDLLKKTLKQVPVTTPDGEIVTRQKNDYEVLVPLSQLIKIASASKGAEVPDEDKTPDVVYQENGITIWNGSKEDNCIRYGSGESWCITRSSWADHRYSEGKKYPSFYLAKNSNLPDSNKLSFIVVAVLEPTLARGNKQYVLHDRGNYPHYPDPITFEELLNQASWLRDIPNIKSILKYIPLSTKEKTNQIYKNKAISIREWVKFPFEVKKQYLVVRKDKDLFTDISDDTFIQKYLPKYPQIATFITTTAGVLSTPSLIKNLEYFSNQDVKSIISNMREKIDLRYIAVDSIPFDVKKFLVKFDKWDISKDQRLYVTQDGSTIVKLTLGDNISVGLYQAEDDYPNVKLNKRTSKYLVDYPELDRIPLKNLVKLAGDEIIDKDLIIKVIDNAKKDPNSALIVKDTDEGTIILDSNTFASYKLSNEGSITPLSFKDEAVQKVFADSKDNEAFQKNAFEIFSNRIKIPESIDRDALSGVIRAIPFNQRITTLEGVSDQPVVLLTTESEKVPFFFMYVDPLGDMTVAPLIYGASRGSGGGDSWRNVDTMEPMNLPMYQSYFTYLRQINKSLNDNDLLTTLGSERSYYVLQAKKAFVQADPPVDPSNVNKIAINGDDILLINTANPRESRKISNNSGKLIKANVPASLAARLLGNAAPAAVAQAATGRRGRPAGQPNAPQAAAAPTAAGDINVGEVMQETGLDTAFLRLPRSIIRKLNVTNASRVAPNGDRGAARRNNQLGGRGQVGRILSIGNSKIYIIRLANGQIIASINVQPGNSNYVLLGNQGGNNAISLSSPSDLVNVLTQRGLAEHYNYLVREFMANYPEHVNETKEILKKHLNK